MKYLKVTNVDPISDKHGNKGKKVSFGEFSIVDGVHMPTRISGSRNFWPDRTLPSKDGSGTVDIQGDVDFLLITKGDCYAEAEITRFNTTDYQVNGFTVNTWKGVFFKGEDQLRIAGKQLSDHGASVIDPATGKPYAYQARQRQKTSTPETNLVP